MNKRLTALVAALLTGLSVLWGGVIAHAVSSDTAADANALHDGILDYLVQSAGADSTARYIEGALCEGAGTTSEFIAIALSQDCGESLASYERALLSYLDTHEVYSAVTREKYALALIAAGSTDSRIESLVSDAVGAQGIMSLVFGLHVLNNGYRCGDHTAEEVLNTLVGMQLSDGGWAVMGSRSDTDVTAMTLQAMAPYYGVYGDVTDSIDRALDFLSGAQERDGAYRSMGVVNAESTAQVLLALSELGIDQNADRRFIKNQHTVLEALMRFQNADGSVGHTQGGVDQNAVTQAFYTVVGYRRMLYGEGRFYLLDRRDPSGLRTPSTPSNNASPAPSQRGGSSRTGQQIESEDEAIEYIEIVDSDGTTRRVPKQTESPTAPTEALTDRSTDPSRAAVIGTTPAASPIRALQSASIDEAGTGSGFSYKPWVILGIFTAAGTAALVLVLLKKRSYKNFLVIVGVAMLGVIVVLLTNFQSPAQHYAEKTAKANPVGTVTITIRCDVITDEDMPYYLPADGVILPESTYAVEAGDTVLDILAEAAAEHHITYENDGTETTAYIAGIAQLYEFEYGELSGWMYRVNGETPSVGCNSYVLRDGDRIEWLYTENIGSDLDIYP